MEIMVSCTLGSLTVRRREDSSFIISSLILLIRLDAIVILLALKRKYAAASQSEDRCGSLPDFPNTQKNRGIAPKGIPFGHHTSVRAGSQ